MPDYTGLKDFAKGVQRLYKMYGNVPVFLMVDGRLAPFGIALTMSELLDGEAIVLNGGIARNAHEFKKGSVTE